MAGLDGVENKIHPGEAATKDLYHLPPEEDAKIPTVCHSLDQALDYLDKDRAFLTKGGVFTDAYIDAYIELKMQEVTRFRMTTHPVEFDMYYCAVTGAAACAASRDKGTAAGRPFSFWRQGRSVCVTIGLRRCRRGRPARVGRAGDDAMRLRLSDSARPGRCARAGRRRSGAAQARCYRCPGNDYTEHDHGQGGREARLQDASKARRSRSSR